MGSFNNVSLEIQEDCPTSSTTLENFEDSEFDPNDSTIDYLTKMSINAVAILHPEGHAEEEEQNINEFVLKTSSEMPDNTGSRTTNNMSNSEIYHSPNLPVEELLPREHMENLQKLAEGQVIEEIQLVMQKKLFATDVNPNNNRLSLPIRKLQHKFLTENETRELELREEKGGIKRLEVDVIEPSLEKCKLSLRRWEMRKRSNTKKRRSDPSITYVLTEKWNEVVQRNSFKEEEILQMYTARVNRKLWFLLVKLPEENYPTSLSLSLSPPPPSSVSASASPPSPPPPSPPPPPPPPPSSSSASASASPPSPPSPPPRNTNKNDENYPTSLSLSLSLSLSPPPQPPLLSLSPPPSPSSPSPSPPSPPPPPPPNTNKNDERVCTFYHFL